LKRETEKALKVVDEFTDKVIIEFTNIRAFYAQYMTYTLFNFEGHRGQEKVFEMLKYDNKH
jgi:hypothetical protein